MRPEVLLSVGLTVVGSALLLFLRLTMRPVPIPLPIKTSRSKDWSDASFGLDLVVAAAVSSPAALVLRLGLSDRLGVLKDATPAKDVTTKAAVDLFFTETQDATAASHLILVMVVAILCAIAYVVWAKTHGYDADVPKGCSHPSLLWTSFVIETAIGVAVSMGALIVAAKVLG